VKKDPIEKAGYKVIVSVPTGMDPGLCFWESEKQAVAVVPAMRWRE
jgi:hypothetical protein